MNNFLAIIPCCGYGTRMNMPIDRSKELLINPSTGKPLIEWHIDLCKEYDVVPLIITRIEKQDLIQWCKERNIETLIVEPKGEWMNTVLQSAHKWMENNILLLPDTIFEPKEIIEHIKNTLEYIKAYSVLAVHKVDDPDKWGIVHDYYLYEKPKKFKDGYAWGVLGWKRHEGHRLFTSLIDLNMYLLYNSSVLYLNEFKDLTRK